MVSLSFRLKIAPSLTVFSMHLPNFAQNGQRENGKKTAWRNKTKTKLKGSDKNQKVKDIITQSSTR